MSEAYCPSCEASYEVDDDVDFCPNCSTPLHVGGPPAEADPDAEHDKGR